MSNNSTNKPKRRKAVVNRPKKPYAEFPLTPHASGKWQKKIRGKIHYFGTWAKRVDGKMTRIEGDGWKEALELYKAQADDLHAGKTPRLKGDGLTVGELCNRFFTAKTRACEAGEITARTLAEYTATTDRLAATFGATRLVDDLAADDFEEFRDTMAKQWGPVRLGNEIQKVRTVFKYGYESGLIEKPIRYGPTFKKPSASVLRRHRAKNGEHMLEADELRRLLDAAPAQLQAMLMLGINGGLGNHDCALLPLSALDLDAGWLNFPRPKTGIPRRFALWPETVQAIRAAIAERPEPRQDDAAELVFVTTRGRSWLVNGIANPISVAARDLLKKVKIHHAGIGFYTLRHVFRTVADGSRDQVAVNYIMGHADSSMAATYRERIDDGRLLAVTEHVRQWLFGKPPDDGQTTEEPAAANDGPGQQATADRDEVPVLRLYKGGAA